MNFLSPQWCQSLVLSLGQVQAPRHGQRAHLGQQCGCTSSATQLIPVFPLPFHPLSGVEFANFPTPASQGLPGPSPCLSFPGLNQGEQPVPSTQPLQVEPSCPERIPASLSLSQGAQPAWILEFPWAQLGGCSSTLRPSLPSRPKMIWDNTGEMWCPLLLPTLTLHHPG